MNWWETKSRGWIRAALVVIGMALPYSMPAEVDARCSCHLRFLHELVGAQPVVTRDLCRETPTTPISMNSLRPLTKLQAQTWTSCFARELENMWSSLVRTSVAHPPCRHCPSNPASPGVPCRGPFCSGDAPPIAVPIYTSLGGANEPATLPALRSLPRNDQFARRAEPVFRVQLTSFAASIFHPPRSI
jgi:hypothetical protein